MPPQENQRVEVSRIFLKAVIEGIQIYVHNTSAELAFNLDETGITESEDQLKEK
jgi:hypothetical protein